MFWVIIGANLVLALSFLEKLCYKDSFSLMAAVTLRSRPRSSILDLCQELSKVQHWCKFGEPRCYRCGVIGSTNLKVTMFYDLEDKGQGHCTLNWWKSLALVITGVNFVLIIYLLAKLWHVENQTLTGLVTLKNRSRSSIFGMFQELGEFYQCC